MEFIKAEKTDSHPGVAVPTYLRDTILQRFLVFHDDCYREVTVRGSSVGVDTSILLNKEGGI